MAQTLIEYATLSAAKALSSSDVGESFNYESIKNKQIIACNKFESDINFDEVTNENDIDLPSSGTNGQNIKLQVTFLKERSGRFDCVFMSSTRNNFVSRNNRNRNRNSF